MGIFQLDIVNIPTISLHYDLNYHIFLMLLKKLWFQYLGQMKSEGARIYLLSIFLIIPEYQLSNFTSDKIKTICRSSTIVLLSMLQAVSS